jgi:hypothetical protein
MSEYHQSCTCKPNETCSVCMTPQPNTQDREKAEDFEVVNAYIKQMPAQLFDLLYDLDLLPEQTRGDGLKVSYMMRIALHVMEDDELRTELKAAKERDRWISVEERLPNQSGFYLTFDTFSESIPVKLNRFNIPYWQMNHSTVTHWRDLPGPPK